MCNETIAVNIIRRARKNKLNAHFTVKEITFVLEQMDLNAYDKLLWLKVSCLTQQQPTLTCTINLRDLCEEMKIPFLEVIHSLCRLQQLGFMVVGWNLELEEFDEVLPTLSRLRLEPFEHLSLTELLELKKIQSVHCTLVMPNVGLIELLDENEYSQEFIEKNGDVRRGNWLKRMDYLRLIASG